MAARRVLVTGVAGAVGQELARRLEREPGIEAVIGLDTRPPEAHLERTELIEADLRNPALSRIMPATEVDTIVHCGIVLFPEPGKPAAALHDINVIGTLQLLAACERTPTLRSLVVRGSAAIYGSEPASPSFLTEAMARRFPLRTRFQRDIAELENYIETFSRRRPEVACGVLRFQPEIGPGLDTPLTRYLSLPAIPTQLGFDPRLQLVHEDDVTGALLAAVRRPIRGPVNIAPDGMVSLTRLVRMAGRMTLPVPHPAFGPLVGRIAGPLGLGPLGEDAVRLLRYGRCLDNARMRSELGYEPAFDAVGAVRDHLAKARGRGGLGLPSVGRLVGSLAGT